MEFHENPAHAQTVDTRPFFFLPRAKRAARLPAREKRGTGDEANSSGTVQDFQPGIGNLALPELQCQKHCTLQSMTVWQSQVENEL